VIQIGDIIVVVARLQIPFALRHVGRIGYYFVGGCWIIESEIKDLRSMDIENGFSPVMSGSACKGLPDDYEAELFTIN
jgi:hypothetical protein